MDSLKICIVIVTYGDRWQFLQRVVKRVLSFRYVSNVVIVDNDSDYSVSKAANTFNDKRISVLRQPENSGSAGGYHEGIRYAKEHTTANLIWLLDDDNLPKENAAEILIASWNKTDGDDESKALFCFRQDRMTHLRIAKGQDPANYYLVPDNFMGFHLFRLLHNRLRKAKNPHIDRQPILPMIKMPYVPYGGFLMHRKLVEKIGYPDTAFFVYADDSEYTYRVTQSGGAIWLISDAEVTDIDPSQGNNYKTGIFRSPLLDLWNFRTFYQVRNRIYFYSRVSVKHRWLYRLNQFIFMTQLLFFAICSGKMNAYKGFKEAVKHGHQGLLGKVDTIPGT